jgi:hypothetical protein
MKIFGKTVAYWKELYGGPFFGICFFLIVLSQKPQFDNWKDYIKEFPTIGMCAFGFLLTFLGIILQGNSSTIEWLKKGELFPRLISFNKRIVSLSLFLSIYSYLLAFCKFDLITKSIGAESNIIFCIQEFSISAFVGLVIFFVYDLIVFINIFYSLIKGKP